MNCVRRSSHEFQHFDQPNTDQADAHDVNFYKNDKAMSKEDMKKSKETQTHL